MENLNDQNSALIKQFEDKTNGHSSVILLSNAEHRPYIRGGDGDFMNAIHVRLEEENHCCLRIVEYLNQNDAQDSTGNVSRLQALSSVDVPVFAKKEKETNKEYENRKIYGYYQYRERLQNNFLHMLKKLPEETAILLYIGSRPQVKPGSSKGIKSFVYDSGSLFSGDFLKSLKDEFTQMKIIVCCLEHAYFTLSIQGLPGLKWQIENHLAYADSIHFINESDKKHFESIIEQEGSAFMIKPHESLCNVKTDDLKLFSSDGIPDDGISDKIAALKLKKTSCKFISGLSTIPPLDQEIVNTFPHAQREKKVLWFGLVRPRKGLDDAASFIDLCRQLKNNGYTMVIAGSFDQDTGGNKSVFAKLLKESIKGQEPLSDDEFTKLFETSITEESVNDIYKKIYSDLAKRYEFPFELHVNVSEKELQELSLQCRYGFKIDDKGMANNSSVMVSYLGLYLPVITTIGILTDEKFKTGIYKDAILFPSDEGCELKLNRIFTKIPSNDAICQNIIETDADAVGYVNRVNAVIQINTDKYFGVSNIIDDIVKWNMNESDENTGALKIG